MHTITQLSKYSLHNLEESAALCEPNKKPYNKLVASVIRLLSLNLVLFLLRNIFLHLTAGAEKRDFCHLNAALL